MKHQPFKAAFALGTALATALAPAWAQAQAAFEYKSYKQGLVVSSTAETEAAALALSTNAINFGDVATNSTETRQVRVSNPGTGELTFTAAPAVTGAAEFIVGTTSCGATLAAGAECLAEVTFSPTSVGAFNGALTFTSALAGSPHEVTLVGSAFNPVSLAATVLPKGIVGVSYSYDFKQVLSVSNEAIPDKSQASWTGSGVLPAGLSFNPSTGVLSGTPSELSPGTSYTVLATYKNNQGQQVYTLKVGEAVLDAVGIAAGINHTCAITTEGGVKCWGQGGNWALGNGSSANRSTPVQVTGLTSGVTHITAGASHTCAIQAGGAKCWGSNGSYQLGDGTGGTGFTPVQVSGLTTGVTSISAGVNHTCAVHYGAAKCWGANSLYQMGNGTSTIAATPVQVSGLTADVVSVSAGWRHTCAIVAGGGRQMLGV